MVPCPVLERYRALSLALEVGLVSTFIFIPKVDLGSGRDTR